MASAVKLAMSDTVITFFWVFWSSILGLFTSIIACAIGIEGRGGFLLITTILVYFLFLVFNLISIMLGGASFNPTGIVAFYAAGVGSDSLFSMALRFPAQALGALGGASAIMEIMPLRYKNFLGGPSLKVDLHNGAMVEGLLTFIISFTFLFIILKGPNNPLIQTWLLSMSTVILLVGGSRYTGPAMNPANAFGWAYIDNRHNTWEQLYVYWISPFVGAILAGWIFRVVFTPPVKEKKA